MREAYPRGEIRNEMFNDDDAENHLHGNITNCWNGMLSSIIIWVPKPKRCLNNNKMYIYKIIYFFFYEKIKYAAFSCSIVGAKKT